MLPARFVSLRDALAAPKSERGGDSALTPRVMPFPALELGPLLGRGSYGRVYRGKHLGRPVAVKVGARGAAHTPSVCVRRVVAGLTHSDPAARVLGAAWRPVGPDRVQQRALTSRTFYRPEHSINWSDRFQFPWDWHQHAHSTWMSQFWSLS